MPEPVPTLNSVVHPSSRRAFVRFIAGGAALSLAGTTLVACGGSTLASNTPASSPHATTAKTIAKSSAAVGSSTGSTVDVDKAKKEGTVQLYTSLDTKIVDDVIKGFKDKYGIDVQYYRATPAQITGKVLQEADAGKVQADIVDASDVGAFLVLKKRGILRPYDSPASQAVAANLRDPDGTWVADRLTQVVIQYNTSLVKAAPKHWKDLADQQYAGKLAFSASSAGDSAPRLYTLAKAFGYDLLQSYATLKPLRLDTPQLVTQAIENGERWATFDMNDNIAQRSKLQGKSTEYLFPDEGVPTEPGAIGLIKDSAHPTAAALFFDWWMGKEGQKILVDGGKYSSRSDLDPPKGNPPLSQLKLLVLDYNEYQANRSDILERMTKIFGGEWGV